MPVQPEYQIILITIPHVLLTCLFFQTTFTIIFATLFNF